MRMTPKGQVTIPVEIREKLGLLPRCEVEFEVVGNAVRIRRARARPKASRGRSMIEQLRGKGSVRMSTEEILALTRGRR